MSKQVDIFRDPLIARKSKIAVDALHLQDQAKDLLPTIVEVSESGTCNRSCSFCPRSTPGFPYVKKFLEPTLLEKLVSQLAAAGFKGLFLFSGFSEPLMDKNIFNLIQIVRKHLSESRIEMVSNGDLLTREKLLKLYESGLNTLLLSVYDGKERAEELEQVRDELKISPDQLIVRHRYLPPEQNFGITMTNRGGMMENAEFKIAPLSKAMNRACFYPTYTFFMDYNGDVLMCPHDWGKKMIMGNMNEENFEDIWFARKFITVRKKLSQANRGFSPCNVCDADGTLIGEEHAKAWANKIGYEVELGEE